MNILLIIFGTSILIFFALVPFSAIVVGSRAEKKAEDLHIALGYQPYDEASRKSEPVDFTTPRRGSPS